MAGHRRELCVVQNRIFDRVQSIQRATEIERIPFNVSEFNSQAPVTPELAQRGTFSPNGSA